MSVINLFAVSGSLRNNSANMQVLQFIAAIAPAHVQIELYNDLAAIPPFDDGVPTEAVLNWRQKIRNADGIIFCSPEYAFGVSGVLKNVLDWTVSSADLDGKPISLITAATGGEKAHAALLPTLNVISGNNVVPEASLLISFIRAKMNKEGIITDDTTAQAIKDTLQAFIDHIALAKANNAPD